MRRPSRAQEVDAVWRPGAGRRDAEEFRCVGGLLPRFVDGNPLLVCARVRPGTTGSRRKRPPEQFKIWTRDSGHSGPRERQV